MKLERHVITLQTETGLSLVVNPEQGAAARAFSCVNAAGQSVSVFQEANSSDPSADGSALFPMVPFANRARGNRLRMRDGEILLQPNTDEPWAIHGFGWQRAWDIDVQTATSCKLRLESRAADPVSCVSELVYDLSDAGLTVSLSALNSGTSPIPVGLGLHPYYPHLSDTFVRFKAREFWLTAPDVLPTEAISIPPELSFENGALVPSVLRDNCYSGWEGPAVIEQPSLGYHLRITGDESLRFLMLYTPQTGVFALEQQSHLSGQTIIAPDGLRLVDPGETLSCEVTFAIEVI